MAATMTTLRKMVAKHGGTLKPDGAGGFDVLADPEAKRRWIGHEVWCQPLPLGEYDQSEWPDLIQSVIDGCSLGTEPFPESR